MDEPISKSQKKRQAIALQNLGVKLISLPPETLAKLPLPENLLHAVVMAKSMTSHGAIRRQAQLIGKLMRTSDHETILNAYNALEEESQAKSLLFHKIEQWREDLMTEGKAALTAFINSHPETDVQVLRQLVKKAIEEKNQAKTTTATKALFRFIRSCSGV